MKSSASSPRLASGGGRDSPREVKPRLRLGLSTVGESGWGGRGSGRSDEPLSELVGPGLRGRVHLVASALTVGSLGCLAFELLEHVPHRLVVADRRG
jgi:hypothetical protein